MLALNLTVYNHYLTYAAFSKMIQSQKHIQFLGILDKNKGILVSSAASSEVACL